MAPETEPLDALTIGEIVVDFISVEKTDTHGGAPERCAYFAREVAEMKLTRTGPMPDEIDRSEIYACLETVHTDMPPKGN